MDDKEDVLVENKEDVESEEEHVLLSREGDNEETMMHAVENKEDV